MRSNYRLGWSGNRADITPETLPSYLPQRINAGAWLADPANSAPTLISKPFGTSPGGTYNIYPTINFPAVWQVSAQYWYVETSPPIGWTSTKLKFRVHFIVDQTISLPGGYRFTLGVRRNPNNVAPSGAKTTGNIDYDLSDATIPYKKITAISSEITIAGAVDTDGLALELTRGTNPTSDESDSAWVIGVDLYFV